MHRPLTVLTDRPAHRDAIGIALWQAHVARAIRQVRGLRVGLPRPGLARRDRYALRGALVVALVASVVIAGEDAPARLEQAVQPTSPRAAAPPATELQAWITPPAYTRLAPMFLKPEGGAVSAPAGSRLTVNVTGDTAAPSLVLGGQSAPFRSLDKSSFQADRTLTSGGHLAVRRGGSELVGWDLTVVADQPPTAAWSEPPGPASGNQQIRLPWRVSDDYGVVGVQAELRLRDRPDAPPLVVQHPGARRQRQVRTWGQPAGPHGASLGRAAGDCRAAGARCRGPIRQQRRRGVRAAGAGVPESAWRAR